MAKAVVLGGNGFLGSHLVDALSDAGHEVSVFDRFSADFLRYQAPGVTPIRGDFLNRKDLARAVEGQELLFHFLSLTTPVSAEHDPTLDVRTNVAQSIELFHLAAQAGIKHVYFSSTGGAIYGPQGLPEYSETSATLPVSPYGIGKLTIERYLEYFATSAGLSSTSLRISNPYGPRQRVQAQQGLIPIALRRIADNLPVIRYGEGTMVRDYVYVSDVIGMIMKIVESQPAHKVYNLGSGTGHSINEVLAAIARVTGREPAIDQRPTPATFVDRVVLNTARFTEEFGQVAMTDLDEGMTALWGQEII